MSAVKKALVLLLSLVLVLAFALVTFVGCEELSQEEIDQIITNVVSAQYDTVNFDMEMPMTMKAVGGSEPGTMTMDVDGSGVIDLANEEMKMTMNMAMDIPGVGEQEMAAEIYIVGDWMYTKMDLLGLGEYWTKMELTEEMWQQQSQIEPLVEFLATAVKIDYLGTKTLNGTECYLFEVVPDMGELGELLAQGTSGMGIMDFGQLNLTDLYKNFSCKEWIAKDSYLLMRVELEMVMEMSGTDDFGEITVDVTMVENFYDYNQPVSIELPPEALEAEEMPY
jgi:hypothetical protein